MTAISDYSNSDLEPAKGDPVYRRVVLLGFMGSGKTAIGRSLAARLRWRHLDLDSEIVRRKGVSIAEIFAAEGEAAFRALEVAVTPEVARLDRVVISPGGGWITNPGLLESLPTDTLTVWLKVSRKRLFAASPATREHPCGLSFRETIQDPVSKPYSPNGNTCIVRPLFQSIRKGEASNPS